MAVRWQRNLGWGSTLIPMNPFLRPQAMLRLAGAAGLLLALPTYALNYAPTHLLLVLQADGFSEVEIDLGPVAGFQGLANGTKVPVQYDVDAVRANFNNSLNGVKFLIVGATALGDSNPRVWLGDVNLTTVPKDLTLSRFAGLRGKIDAVGTAATSITGGNAAPYVVVPTSPTSFSYIVSGGTGANVGTMNGDSPFGIDAVNPTTVKFYELHVSAATPKPDATLVGAFTIDATGALYFTAGQLPALASTSLSLARSGSLTSVSFATQPGTNYRLFAASTLPGAWTPVGSPIAGTGDVLNITESTTESFRFYKVQSLY